MVLDPISAFSLACNILQVVETAAKVLDKAAEYHSASDGILSEQRDLKQTYSNLEKLNNDLQVTLSSLTSGQQRSAAEVRLVECNVECLRLSGDFIGLLDQLKVKKPGAVLEGIGRAIKAMRYKDKIETMEKSVSRARDNLTLAFIVYMESNQRTNATQTDIFQSTSNVQNHIVQAVNNSTTMIHDEVRDLSLRLDSMNLDTVRTTFVDFAESHRQTLAHIASQLQVICATQSRAQDDRAEIARQNILQSLSFEQMYDRRDQIAKAYHDTYRWVLSPDATGTKWDNLVTWLDDRQPQSNIYWITSKPGAGKSSLVRFLASELDADEHMPNWTSGSQLIKLQHYFWISGGDALQKNTAGFLRSILHQLLETDSALLSACIPHEKLRIASALSPATTHWSVAELQTCLKTALSLLAPLARCLILIDGLDEIDGEDDAREKFIEHITNLSSLSNVKLCLSSRSWPIFQDAFGKCPQMRLQDLNYHDIELFVSGHFNAQPRFRQILLHDNAATTDFVREIVDKSEGVFLWARLVVAEFMRGIRDGDSGLALQSKLQAIPTSLDNYFQRILDSIEPQYRQEASVLFQIALFRERRFISLHPLRLIDLMFIDEATHDFALNHDMGTHLRDLSNYYTLTFRLDSTLRRLSSRCKGLLECFWKGRELQWEDFDFDSDDDEDSDPMGSPSHAITSLSAELMSRIKNNQDEAFGLRVDFMHRSLADYLRGPGLHRSFRQLPLQSDCLDVRNYLRNARLIQTLLLAQRQSVGAVGLASYVFCSLSLPSFREDARCFHHAKLLQTTHSQLFRLRPRTSNYWYIHSCLNWNPPECSNFFSLAIDFALTGYLNQALTRQEIQTKSGRPLLDYALRPRFSTLGGARADFGNRCPLPELVRALLLLGSDPNQLYGGRSIWLRFIGYIRDQANSALFAQTSQLVFLSLEEMVRHGAAVAVPQSALAIPDDSLSDSSDDLELFVQGYPFYGLVWEAANWFTGRSGYHIREPKDTADVSTIDVLESIRPIFGEDVDHLKALARHRNVAV